MTSGARRKDVNAASDDEVVAEPTPTLSDLPASSASGRQLDRDRAALTTPEALARAVPVRRRASVDGAPLRAAFLLSHVDNRMTVKQLATSAQIPLADAIECFELLVDLGVIELRAADDAACDQSRPPLPKSGLHPKT